MRPEMPYGLLIKQIHDAIEKRANNDLRSQDITLAQLMVLRTLHEAADQTVPLKVLEYHIKVAQSTMAGIVARLAQKGFVESIGDASDKRVKLVRLTPSGEACCEKVKEHMEATERFLLSALSAQEQTIFYDLLQKVSKSIRSATRNRD